MGFINRKADYVAGNLETIKNLAKDINDKQIDYLYDLIWYGGYKAVRGNIIQAIRHGYDHQILSSDEEFARIKKRCSEKTWACLILWTIWQIYYSPLMMEFKPQDAYHPIYAHELGSKFFSAHEIIIDYWPFSNCANPFHELQRALELHCYTQIRP